jgi:recombination protein RecT
MASNQQLTPRQATSNLVDVIKGPDYTAKFKQLLPADVPVARFQEIVVLAVQMNPDLVRADKTSLLLACQNAAKSGLLPDGKEGALVQYGNKVQWQVMIAGLRKVLAKHGFDLRTESVFEHDTFDYDLGDDPRITHKRPPLGQKRGAFIGAYAIARGPDGRLYRHVMDKEAIDFVKSKAKSGNVWGTWYNAMAEKTVGRALVKQLPLYREDRDLRELIDQDNEHFDLDTKPEPSAAAKAAQAAARNGGKATPEAAPPGEVIDVETTDVTEQAQQSGDNGTVIDPLADDIPF